jgi:hypothetical protein
MKDLKSAIIPSRVPDRTASFRARHSGPYSLNHADVLFCVAIVWRNGRICRTDVATDEPEWNSKRLKNLFSFPSVGISPELDGLSHAILTDLATPKPDSLDVLSHYERLQIKYFKKHLEQKSPTLPLTFHSHVLSSDDPPDAYACWLSRFLY